MVRRKGEMRAWHIDTGWPHQVALHADVSKGKAHETVRAFCKDLSLSPRGHSFAREDGWWNVWCFATKEGAEKFRAQFGGEFLAPSDRPKWGEAVRRNGEGYGN